MYFGPDSGWTVEQCRESRKLFWKRREKSSLLKLTFCVHFNQPTTDKQNYIRKILSLGIKWNYGKHCRNLWWNFANNFLEIKAATEIRNRKKDDRGREGRMRKHYIEKKIYNSPNVHSKTTNMLENSCKTHILLP